MNLVKHSILSAVIALCVVAGWAMLVGDTRPVEDPLGGTRYPHGVDVTADGDYKVDGTTVIDSSGNLDGAITSGFNGSFTTSGTTTLSLKTTSATKGFCIEAHATSSNTLVNITATTTNALSGGTPFLVQFGACP